MEGVILTLSGERVGVELDESQLDPKVPICRRASNGMSQARGNARRDLELQNHDPGDVVWFKEISVRR
jgi:hypothetical protein